ncbi:MAG: translational GTPase TypA [Bdellovibrionota bacterium]
MDLRNICIIAHVDHGKTTLVDHLLKQSDTFGAREQLDDRVMDSMDLERERGITISAKNAAIKKGDTKINIVDTPGHADFGGEVERILGMVDGACLLVDGAEGPLPQTRFVLQKALQRGQKVILVVNKVDRPECRGTTRVQEIVDQTFDLFIDLGATDAQAEFKILYACARYGWATENFDEVEDLIEGRKKGSLEPLFKAILSEIAPAKVDLKAPFQMLISNIGWNDFVGRLAIGRITAGQIKATDQMYRKGINSKGEPLDEKFKALKIFTYNGLKQVDAEVVQGGDIVAVAGSDEFQIGDTLTQDPNTKPLERIHVTAPTLAMVFSVNTSPFSGRDGEAVQSRKLRERLLREVRHNVAIKFGETEVPDQFRIFGRGELQFSILIEQMRREGVEIMVGKPIVLTEMIDGVKHEPLERLNLDLPEDYASDVTRMFQERKGVLVSYENAGSYSSSTGVKQRVRLEFDVPTRGLLGMRSKYLTATRGEGIMSSIVIGMTPWKGDMVHRTAGAMISDRTGTVTEYALQGLEDRGMMFVKPGVDVYEGMIIGEFNKDNDLNVNAVREKKLTNVRASGAEILVALKGVREMSLEKCLEWIDEDEWIEITPKEIRLRKKILAQNMRSIRRG